MQREQCRTALGQGFGRDQGCCSQEHCRRCTTNISDCWTCYWQAPAGRTGAQIQQLQQLTGTAAPDRQNTQGSLWGNSWKVLRNPVTLTQSTTQNRNSNPSPKECDMSVWEKRLERSGRSAGLLRRQLSIKERFESERGITAYFIRINKMFYDLY